MRGVRSGDKGRGKDGEPLGNFEPGSDVVAQATVLAEGCWGHLTGAAIREFDLGADREPQVWELGVKEVWKVPKPLDRVIHTLGLAAALGAKYERDRRHLDLPDEGDRPACSIGFVVDLDYADATTSAHDLLQQFKTHPLVREILEGGERVAWGAKAIPGGGYWSMPKLLDARAGASSATPAGWSTCPRSRASTTPSRRACWPPRRSTPRSSAARPTSQAYERGGRGVADRQGALRSRATRASPSPKGFFEGGPIVNAMVATKGRFPGGRWTDHRNAEHADVRSARRRRTLSQARRQVHVRQALERLHHRQRDARRRAQPHPRAARTSRARSPRRGRGCARPASTRSPTTRPRTGNVDVDRQLHELRAVRRDHRQGRAPDDARGRRRAALPDQPDSALFRRNLRVSCVVKGNACVVQP